MLAIEEYTANIAFIYVEGSEALGGNREKARHEFQMWLSELIRKEREEAWTEGVCTLRDVYGDPVEENPYRKETS